MSISSESAHNVPADMIHYGVTKTAQLSLVGWRSTSPAAASPSTAYCRAPPFPTDLPK